MNGRSKAFCGNTSMSTVELLKYSNEDTLYSLLLQSSFIIFSFLDSNWRKTSQGDTEDVLFYQNRCHWLSVYNK